MNRNILQRTSVLLLGTLGLASGAAGQDVTPAERKLALRYLAEGRSGVVEAVKGLSAAQWKFKPAPDRWSIAEVVEHLALVEDAVQKILAGIGQAPAAAPERDAKQMDALILEKVPDRSTRYQAPPFALPTGRWTPAETLKHFLASRAQTTAVLWSSRDLRGHVVSHPVFGPLDGYEWILAVAEHSARHTKQILEVKADPNFPAR